MRHKGRAAFFAAVLLMAAGVATGASAAGAGEGQRAGAVKALELLHDPYEIIDAHYDAAGGLDRLKAIRTRYFEADVSIMGMKGKVKSWEEPPLKQWREMDFGAIKMTGGDNGEVSWIVDPNGKIQIQRDEATLGRRQTEALLNGYEHVNPESEHFTITLEGTDSIGTAECYALKILSTETEEARWRYVNAETFSIEKAIDPQDQFEVHTLLSDYRAVDGIQIAFHRESEILPVGQKQIIQITKYELNGEVDATIFEPPSADVEDFEFTEGRAAEDVPFEYVLDHLYIDVEIGGKTNRWVLDTGASATVVDSTFAAALGLEPVGKAKAVGAGGSVDIMLVTLPPLRIQGVSIAEQQVGAMPLRDLFDKRGIEVAGVLGYDFLSRFVTRIDYANRKISFFHPEVFEYTGDGIVMDAPLTHRLFSLPLTVDDRFTGNWAVDIGASVSAFQHPFARENGLLDREGVDRILGGAGGHVRARVSEFESVEIGGHRVSNPLILIPLENLGALSFKRGNGILGNNILRRFVLYLDYGNQQIILEKGDDFSRDFERDKSGLSVIINQSGDYEAFFISGGTPAEKAGFLKGDIVKSVNGIEVEYLGGPVAVADLFRAEVGTEYEVEVLRDGKPVSIGIRLEDLY
jgi:predicted aspartyl protease